MAGVGRLQKLAAKVREDAENAKGSGEPRGEALNNFIGNLMSAYTETTGRPIGIRRRPPYGPTLRFVRACLTAVSENYPDVVQTVRNLTDGGLAERIRNLKDQRTT